MKRKILSLILVFAMTVSLLTVGTGAVEPTYGDTAGHWAESSIERWSAYGIIQGSNGQFDPNGQLTCAQLATILAKLLKLPAAKDAGFTDNTADAWYYDAINRCAAAGILNGNGDGTVTPEAPITRERAMVMLARALGIEPIRKPDLTKYTDAAQVSAYAQGYVAALIEAGIVGGVTADELAPQDNINRASTVTILDRAISTYADKAGATVKADGKGLVLVVADDVTVTGDVDKLLVPADNVDVTVSGSKNIDDITVTGDNSKVILNNSTANDVTLDGKNTELETKSGSKVENVSVTEDAKGATVNAGSGTTIKNVENSAADTTVTGSGTVKNVASDTDITVETKNTNVENSGDSKITVTDKSGKDPTIGTTGSGSSTVVNKETTSSGGGGYSHSHSYVYTDNGDGTHTGRCYANDSTLAPEAHTIVGGKCTVCGAEQTDAAVASVKAADGTCTYYPTLPGAVAAAADGAIVTVVKNISLDSRIVISKKVTVDLNGKTVTRDMSNVSENFTRNEGNLFTIQSAGDLTLKDSTGNGMLTAIAPADNHYSTDTLVLNYGKFTLESGTIKVPEKVYYAVGCYGKDSVTTINGGVIDAQWGGVSDGGIALGSNGSKSDATYGFTLNINGGEIKGGEQTLYLPGAGKTTITGGKLTGSARGIEIRAGELTITGGEISANVARNTNAAANNGASGSYTGALVAVKPASVSASDYVGDIVLNISGGTFTNASGDVLTAVHETATAQDAPAQNVTVSVSDGQFTGAFNVGNTVNTTANDKLSITGGTFSSNPGEYVAEGYITLVNGGGTFTVSNTNKIPVTTATVQDYLDGKYGSINGKTLVLGEGNYDKIEFGRATAYKGSNTEYYLKDNTSTATATVDEIKQDIADHPNGGAKNRVYVRNMSNVTLKAAEGAAVTINGLVAFGGQVNSTKWYSRDFVADRVAENNNTSYYINQKWNNITFEGLTFTGGVNIEAYQGNTRIDNVNFNGCKFNVSDTETNQTNCIRLNVDGNQAKANNLVVENCEFTDGFTAVLTDGMPNVTVTDSTFSGLTKHAINPMMNWNGAPGYGEITVTGNTFKNMSSETEDNKPVGTILRMGEVGAGAVFTIQNNTATEGITLANSIKVNSLADDGITYYISGNNWGSLTASDSRLNDRSNG